MDVVAFQVVTLGPRPTELFDALQAEINYSDASFLHGWPFRRLKPLPNTCTATYGASWAWLARQGKRYSWGYPAISRAG